MAGEYLDQIPRTEKPIGSFFDVVFGLIVIIAATFSAITTYIGFAYDLPAIFAGLLATIIGLGLLAINFRLRDARREALGVMNPLLAFTLVFIFSFVSNTNAIYSFFIQRDIVGQTQEAAFRVFDSETSKILRLVSEAPQLGNFAQRTQAFDVALANLKKQITDPRNPGLGEIAQRHLAEIRRILNVNLTPQRPPAPGSSIDEFASFAETFAGFIKTQAETQFASDPGKMLLNFAAKIERLRAFYEDKTRRKEYSKDTTDLMSRDLDQLAVQARDLGLAEMTLTPINTSADEIGAFQYTWTNFVNWINPAAIILSVLLGALLDLLAPLICILLYKPEGDFR